LVQEESAKGNIQNKTAEVRGMWERIA